MTKVGEHITLDIIGTDKEYEPKFFEKLVYKIAKKAKADHLTLTNPRKMTIESYELLLRQSL